MGVEYQRPDHLRGRKATSSPTGMRSRPSGASDVQRSRLIALAVHFSYSATVCAGVKPLRSLTNSSLVRSIAVLRRIFITPGPNSS